MFLSDRDIKYAIESKNLIVIPPPDPFGYDENSIDLHLAEVELAKVWDIKAATAASRSAGQSTQNHFLELGGFDYNAFAETCLVPVPDEPPNAEELGGPLVYRQGQRVVLKPYGFLLWMTKEVVGTPEDNPELISFVNAKSTKARTGIMVHFTAPTINSGWKGQIVLELVNLGPFTFVLKPGDAIAQLTVATISSRPDPQLRSKKKKSHTMNQADPSGRPAQ